MAPPPPIGQGGHGLSQLPAATCSLATGPGSPVPSVASRPGPPPYWPPLRGHLILRPETPPPPQTVARVPLWPPSPPLLSALPSWESFHRMQSRLLLHTPFTPRPHSCGPAGRPLDQWRKDGSPPPHGAPSAVPPRTCRSLDFSPSWLVCPALGDPTLCSPVAHPQGAAGSH